MNNKYDELNLRKFKMKSILPDATVLLLGRRRSGKCLLKGTRVVMGNGEVECIENIKKGHIVMGNDSTPRTVLSTHNGYDTMYKITNQFGESYVVNSQHTLSLVNTFVNKLKECNTYYKLTMFNTDKMYITNKIFHFTNNNKDIIYQKVTQIMNGQSNIVNIPIETYLSLDSNIKKYLKGYQKPLSFPENTTKITPYLFGLLINNTYKKTTSHKLLKFLSDILPLYNSYLMYNQQLRSYQIMGELRCIKFDEIPFDYKINSYKNRLYLLLGILRVHDYFFNGFYCTTYFSCSKMIYDVEFLIKSMGFSIIKIHDNNGIDYKVYITSNDNILLTHADFLNSTIPEIITNDINITSIGVDEYYGIQIDNNSLFVLDNFVVTHNSWLVRDIFYHHKHIPSGVVFSGTEEANPFFGEFIPDCFIHSEYDPELVDKIMGKQKKKIRDAKNAGSKDGKSPSNNLFIVFDDMLHDAQNWKNDKTVKNIFFNGRHYNFLFILTMQYPLGITPALRSNIDYVFIFNEPSLKNRRKIYDDYAAMLPSFDHFCNILDACSQNHECLVIKTSGNSSDLRDIVFWYKAEPHNNFRVGHDKFWKFHKQHYNKNYEDDNHEVEEKVNELKDKFSNTKKLKVIVSRQDDKIVDLEY